MNIVIKDLVKSYQGQVVLDIKDFSVQDIQTLAIVGPSGGGKSTLLKILATIEQADSGSALVNGQQVIGLEDPTKYLHQVGYVFQTNNLFPHLTVLENVMLHLKYTYKVQEKQAKQLSQQWLMKVGVLEHQNKKIHQISGGQAQRAAIVRALVSGAKLLMLDEPTSALDPELAYDVMKTLIQLKEETDIIAITHELNFARQFAQYFIFVDEGKILLQGPIAALFDNEHPRVTDFVNKIEFK